MPKIYHSISLPFYSYSCTLTMPQLSEIIMLLQYHNLVGIESYSFWITKVTEGTAGNRVQSQLMGLSILVKTICNDPNGLPFSVRDLSYRNKQSSSKFEWNLYQKKTCKKKIMITYSHKWQPLLSVNIVHDWHKNTTYQLPSSDIRKPHTNYKNN